MSCRQQHVISTAGIVIVLALSLSTLLPSPWAAARHQRRNIIRGKGKRVAGKHGFSRFVAIKNRK